MHSEKKRKRRRNQNSENEFRGKLSRREKNRTLNEGLDGSLRNKNKHTYTRPGHSSSRVHGVIVFALLGIERNYYNSKRNSKCQNRTFLANYRVAPASILRLQGRANK